MAKTLSAFLAQNAKKVDNRSIAVSKRFTDESGNPVEWEITCITAGENQRLRKDAMRDVPIPGKRGQYKQEIDIAKYQTRLLSRCVVFPDLSDTALQDSYGVVGSDELISAMLTPGEFDDLVLAVTELCGFTTEGEIVDEAKN